MGVTVHDDLGPGKRRVQPVRCGMLQLIAVRPKAIVVPEEAVVPAEGANAVWVVVDGKATRRPVDLGVRTPGFVEVTKGVNAGEQVVVGGLELLAPGAPVMPRVVERTGKATPAQR